VAFLCLAVPTGSVFAQEIKPKANPTATDIEEAKQHMAAGVAFMQDPDGARYEEAYPEFKSAYQKSGSLNALHNLAICAQKLELDGEAIAYYKMVLEKKGDDLDPTDKQQIERDLAGLESVVAWVTFSSDRPEVKLADTRTPQRGASMRNQYQIGIEATKLGIHPGNHSFIASAEGYPDQEWNIQIKNGSSHNKEFVFDANAPVTAEGWTDKDQKDLTGESQPDEDEGGGVPAYVWIAGGITVAAAIPWAIFGAMSFGKKSDYDAARGTAPLAEQEELKSDLETTNLLADIFMGVTAAGAVATIVLVIVAASSDDEEAAAKDGPRLGIDYTIAPLADPHGAGAVFTATF
jgi:tetratricopeptide (TPR) repeat protein